MKELSHKGVRIIYEDERISEKPVYVTGFRGYGLVGYITTLYLAEKLKCERIGVVITRYMPEAVTTDGGRIVAPFEILACFDGRLLVQVNHDIPHERERTFFAEAIAKWLREIDVSEAILVGGFDARFKKSSEELRWLATRASRRKLEEPIMEKGLYVIGPLALLTLFADLYNIPAIVILPYTEAMRPDPRAAAVAVRKIASIIGFEIDVGELLEEAERIEKMIESMEKRREEAMQPREPEKVYM